MMSRIDAERAGNPYEEKEPDYEYMPAPWCGCRSHWLSVSSLMGFPRARLWTCGLGPSCDSMTEDFKDPLGLGVAVAVGIALTVISSGIAPFVSKRFPDDDRSMRMVAISWIGIMSGNIAASMAATALCGKPAPDMPAVS